MSGKREPIVEACPVATLEAASNARPERALEASLCFVAELELELTEYVAEQHGAVRAAREHVVEARRAREQRRHEQIARFELESMTGAPLEQRARHWVWFERNDSSVARDEFKRQAVAGARSDQDELVALERYRSRFEDIAARKLRSGQVESNGAVRITTMDLSSLGA